MLIINPLERKMLDFLSIMSVESQPENESGMFGSINPSLVVGLVSASAALAATGYLYLKKQSQDPESALYPQRTFSQFQDFLNRNNADADDNSTYLDEEPSDECAEEYAFENQKAETPSDLSAEEIQQYYQARENDPDVKDQSASSQYGKTQMWKRYM